MATITVDFGKTVRTIKPLHGVGQPPFQGIDFSMFHYLTEAGIPFSRLHDVGGAFGAYKFVDVPNIFRDFDADPHDPASYDFGFTDLLVKALTDSKVEPFFRLGVTIENQATVRAYRIYPPKDPLKWAMICEGIIRHYTEGWADGFYYPIRYWEIWGEPDNHPDLMRNELWRGTPEEYFELYRVSASYLKERFPHLKIGGYGSCGFYAATDKADVSPELAPRHAHYVRFFNAFMKDVTEKKVPLDFFSYHTYSDVEDVRVQIRDARRRLDELGYEHLETSLDEWNPCVELRGTNRHAALVLAMMLMMQDEPVDTAMFYDARFGTSVYGSLFNPMTAKPLPAYYGFPMFNALYLRGNEAALSSDDPALYAVAAWDGNGKTVVLANTTDREIPLTLKADAKILSVETLSPEGLPVVSDKLTAIGADNVMKIELV